MHIKAKVMFLLPDQAFSSWMSFYLQHTFHFDFGRML